MAALARFFSIVFPKADEAAEDMFPVLMFTAIGLAAVIGFVLLTGGPPPVELDAF